MEALVVCGSARPDGATMMMCRSAERTLSEMGFTVRTIRPSEMDIGHCRDCGGCRGGACVLNDGMKDVYSMFSGADLLVLTSPIHFSGPSSVIKTFMDRFQPFWYDRSLKHPSSMVVLLCGGSPGPRFEHTVSIMRAFSLTVGMGWLGHMEYPGTDGGTDGLDAAVSSFLLEKVRDHME